MKKVINTLLLVAAGTLATTGCDTWNMDDEKSAPREAWGYNDDPSIFDNNLEYELAALPTSGEADPIPWAGSYWPTYEDSINYKWDGPNSLSPAAKYGEAFGIEGIEDAVSQYHGIDDNSHRTACTQDSQCDSSMGEKCAKRDGEDNGYCIPTWWGLCHGWTPAAILEPEPVEPVTMNGVTFEVNDIKALMTLLYTSTNTKFLSSRCNDNDDAGEIEYDPFDRPQGDCRDTNPGTFHVIATNFLGIKGISFAEDRTFDYQVWNQPMRGFEVTKKEEITWQKANELVGVTATGGDTDEKSGTVAKNEWVHFDAYSVNAGASIKVRMEGSGGDADLYVRLGAQPTASEYDCRPYAGGSNEVCELTVPEGSDPTDVFVSVQGYAETSDFELKIAYNGSAADAYVFNDEAVQWFHMKMTSSYISESASSTDGNLADNINQYTHKDYYEYVLELDGEGRIIGGEWVGSSKKNHPDFLWLPITQTGASKAGGKIKYANVKQILDMSVGDVVNPGGEKETETYNGTVAKDEWKHYGPFGVAEAGALIAEMTGTGDADLYVKKGSQPTTNSYDCRPYKGGSDESCELNGPGDIYVSVTGWAQTSDFVLTVSWDPADGGSDDPGDDPGDEPETGTADESGTVAQGEWNHFGPYNVADTRYLKAVLSGNGDADLYVRIGAQPTLDDYDCRPYQNGSDETCQVDGPGQIYVSVNGYDTSSDYQLHITW